ncbi:MAG: hypothetical protein KF777_05180 [Planctomycetaceae bacterium]|nr:hypothetical protein [Planctomycetaceae bacterium]
MPAYVEGNLTFSFPRYWKVLKYDDSVFHVSEFQSTCGGAKAIDFVALEPNKACCWMIEVKDYRVHCQTNAVDLAAIVAHKVRDTLAGLAVARLYASQQHEKVHAQRALKCSGLRVVLHMENPVSLSALFPQPINPANVLQELKQRLRVIDASLKVVSLTQSGSVAWTVN